VLFSIIILYDRSRTEVALPAVGPKLPTEHEDAVRTGIEGDSPPTGVRLLDVIRWWNRGQTIRPDSTAIPRRSREVQMGHLLTCNDSHAGLSRVRNCMLPILFRRLPRFFEQTLRGVSQFEPTNRGATLHGIILKIKQLHVDATRVNRPVCKFIAAI
jgi:hypothetical protein